MRKSNFKMFEILVIFGNFLLVCLLNPIAASSDKHQSNPIIKVPFLPDDHLLCWWNNLAEFDRLRLVEFCQTNNNNNRNLVNSINFDTIVGYDQVLAKQNFCQLIADSVKYQTNETLLPCWGYERKSLIDCPSLYRPSCPGSSESWTINKEEQFQLFFNTADFGYVQERLKELDYYCMPYQENKDLKSELKCTKYLRYCTGRNIYIDFRKLANLSEPIRYRDDILGPGHISGWNCDLNREKLLAESQHKSTLMSWYSEISNFKVLDSRSPPTEHCDIWIDKPVYIMKLDATINMYHHFCDFINLYISFHLNGSNFDRDNQILIWDSYPYRSNFALIWQAFTSNGANGLLSLNQFRDKKVCFRDVTFPLLPRMIFGLYYNMPLVPGCQKSGLVRAFNRHLLHHLGLDGSEQLALKCDSDMDDTIRIVFISRNTKHRRVLNENELIQSLNEELERINQRMVEIKLVDLNHRMSFLEQVRLTSKADILVGMHGAGLTHCLFQPDYGALFELYNCGDVDCYRDLARLRGVHYETWTRIDKLNPVDSDNSSQQQPQGDRKSFGAAHAKFVNYKFDSEEFVRKMVQIIEVVRNRRKQFQTETEELWWWKRRKRRRAQTDDLNSNIPIDVGPKSKPKIEL